MITDFFTSICSDGMTLAAYLACSAVALVCGILTAFTVSYRNHITRSFLLSLVLLPVIVETVILMVNGNIGTGIAVAGAFSLVRFRSAAGSAKEIAEIFLVMTVGLICAAGCIGAAILFTLIACAVILAVTRLPLASEKELELKITVPESLNYNEAFEELLERDTVSHRLIAVKTTNLGSLYRLTYRVMLKDAADGRLLIDKLRTRNGNLEISLSEPMERNDIL